ncbi:diaminopimelate decarboxylase [Methylophilaceae bacterium]|jgi:diaminopimelate decarboxylase|nr:diaminopimelate decarboxylase [Methylophilaceae bacterium]|tara:strand:+ start:2003 stop:3253 length:1251 start_codon:yes stop_codon:yes gene_type:complete
MSKSMIYSKKGAFLIENVPVKKLADEYGTPAYVYSKKIIEDTFINFKKSFIKLNPLVCFAVKANSNIAILNLLAKQGAGFDIVSGGELKRVIAAKGDPKKLVFSGIGKSIEEIGLAISHDILAFNVESEGELYRIQSIAKSLNKKAAISIRVNPNVDAKTHPYISTGLKDNKFGVDEKKSIELYLLAKNLDSIVIKGIDCHIGSQITEINPFIDSAKKLVALIDHLKTLDINIEHFDIGGGLGINYKDELPPSFSDYADAINQVIGNRKLKIIVEPGRSLIAKAGVLLTSIEYIKEGNSKNFAIVDAAMNDLMRPSLYDAYHEIINIISHNLDKKEYDIVGPVCETGDFFGKNRLLSIKNKDLLAILDTGAYGMSMSSNYNTRPRSVEILVDNEKSHIIRERETFEHLISGESILP